MHMLTIPHGTRAGATVLIGVAATIWVSSLPLRGAPEAPSWANPPTVPGHTQITLQWLDAAGTFSSYSARCRTSNSGEAWTTVTGIPLTSNTYTFTGLNNQRSMEFQVGADDGSVTTWNAVRHKRARGASHTSGIPGGGQVNAIVKASSGIMIVGGDVSGFQRSLDAGETWYQASTGVHRANATRNVAALAHHSASATTYGVTGTAGIGYFWRSLDNGATWSKRYEGAGAAVEANSGVYPRKVGRLIAIEPSDVNAVYLGTLGGGVKKSVDGGVTWSQLMLAGVTIRGIALANGYVYAATDGAYVYRCTTSGASVTQFVGGNAPSTPEELVVVANALYTASNTAGILRLDNASTASATAAWVNLNIGTTTAAWCAIDGYVNGSDHVIVVGNSKPEQLGTTGRYTTVMKCTNAQAGSGFNWLNISSAATTTVSIAMAAGNGETYWKVDPAKQENFRYPPDVTTNKRLDGNSFSIDQIVIDPTNKNKIHVVGQMGMWRTLNGGTTWQPCVLGLSTPVLNCVALDSSHPGRVFFGDTDNGLWVSDDRGESMSYASMPTGLADKPTVCCLDVDPTTGLVYVAIGTSVGANIYSYDRTTRTWNKILGADGLSLKDKISGKEIKGVGVKQVAGSRVLMAAVDGAGLWRLADGGNWTQVQSDIVFGVASSLKSLPFTWSSINPSLIFFYDPPTGVWRSNDAGETWSEIWVKSSGVIYAGSLALRSDATTLFVSTDSGLYRLDSAQATPTIANLPITYPGKLAMEGDSLWVTGRADESGTSTVNLHHSTDGISFTTYTFPYYTGAAGFPMGLAVEPGYQYLAGHSLGIVVSNR